MSSIDVGKLLHSLIVLEKMIAEVTSLIFQGFISVKPSSHDCLVLKAEIRKPDLKAILLNNPSEHSQQNGCLLLPQLPIHLCGYGTP